jgi:hypothetical protein
METQAAMQAGPAEIAGSRPVARGRRRLRVVAKWTLAPGAAVLLLVAWPVAGLGLVAVAWLLRSDPEPNLRN